MQTTNKQLITTLTYGGIFTALVVVLQLIGSLLRFSTFSISLVLIPIVLGAAICNKWIGAWLGLVFGVTVLLSGDATLFMQINIPGTIITVLVKGVCCGLLAGLVYEWIRKKDSVIATYAAAVVCPLVNTGIFLIGCRVFFYDFILESANGTNALEYMIIAFVGINFVIELLLNIALAPLVVRVLQINKKIKA